MLLSVKHIADDGLPVERLVRPQALTSADGRVIPLDPVDLTGVVNRRRGGFRFQGTIRTTGTFECARCLEPFRQAVVTDFDLFYAEVAPGPRLPDDPEESEEAIAFAPLVGQQIDLSALVAEQIYLNLPLKPLCGPSCRGLCPACGVNRNLSECRCETESDGTDIEKALAARPQPGRS